MVGLGKEELKYLAENLKAEVGRQKDIIATLSKQVRDLEFEVDNWREAYESIT